MAWIDDRIWCHPKFNGLTPAAFRAWVNSVSWSCGMQTKGVLTPADQRLVGASAKVRGELVKACLWDDTGNGGTIVIHDWEEHNGRRDRIREANAERKRKQRRQTNVGSVTDA